MVKIEVTDRFDYFLIINYINLALFLFVCIDFDNVASKIPHAFNLGLLLMWCTETAIGSSDWPHTWYTNTIILVLFSAFFYVIIKQLWASVFLVLGMLLVNPVWEGVQIEIEKMLSRMLDTAVQKTNHGYMFTAVSLALLLIVVITVVSKHKCVAITVVAFTSSTKVVTALKAMIYSKGNISCSTDSDSKMCPFWFNQREWLLVLFLLIFRIGLTMFMTKGDRSKLCCNKKRYNTKNEEVNYKLLNNDSTSININTAKLS
jgi:hypothetical protein